ncbi:hypothetical protein JG687_00010137 [Phytophthora cactorum]|uniref:Uncharacterized protein n=1 Tax=Phytophthora cactorum TaxID=29920 RepID=A0A329RZJ5_9STRA|nr:hypothetical protein GQ600_15734 [Phytophthora cactorum]KAF1790142.1 hypothetical protein GQ600_15737 [Phytophthora cactorum]KAF1790790.1 hypothetical protein GQ600_24584 [Phytophthora cactorum]KAF1790797.1 hypothetical protein GQ600_24592 [Phytophthora cactorum]KAG2770718.1 hypothetical protein Pcac1_g18222 [Phytophthora cactorum]
MKHSIFALLFVLVAVMSCAHANDAIPTEAEDLPAGVTLVGGQEPVPEASTEQFFGGRGRFFRHRFRFPYGGGFRYGWRYPLGYWNTFGSRIYGPGCMFGRPIGGFFYC